MLRLSIIVPMYNVAPYVERCIDSLEDQDISKEDYEIICINDGSPDNSREIVEGLQKKYSNIVLINQENQGVSRARNNGIDMAEGKYILMVDPDDYVKPDVLKKKLDILDFYDPDIGITGYIILNNTQKEEYRYDPFYDQNILLTGISYFNSYMLGKPGIRDPDRSVAIFLKTSFLNTYDLRYLADVPYLEDGELIPRILCMAKGVIFMNEPFYLRTTRHGSATHSKLYYTVNAREGFLKAAINLLQFKHNKCKNEEQKHFMNQPIVHFTILYIISIQGFKHLKHYSELVETLKKGPLNKLDTEGCSDFYRKLGNSYNYSIPFFYLNWVFYILRKSLRIKVEKLFYLFLLPFFKILVCKISF